MPRKYTDIKSEVQTDPLGRYGGLNTTQIAISLNEVNRTRSREIVNSWEVYEAVDRMDWGTINTGEKALIRDILSLGEVDARNGSKAASVLVSVFGSDSTTIANLVAVRAENVSRAVELNLGKITPGIVASALVEG